VHASQEDVYEFNPLDLCQYELNPEDLGEVEDKKVEESPKRKRENTAELRERKQKLQEKLKAIEYAIVKTDEVDELKNKLETQREREKVAMMEFKKQEQETARLLSDAEGELDRLVVDEDEVFTS